MLVGLECDNDAIGQRETLNNNNSDKRENKRERERLKESVTKCSKNDRGDCDERMERYKDRQTDDEGRTNERAK